MALLSTALTTPDRVKEYLEFDSTNQDVLLEQLINAATVFIEGRCNRQFLEQTVSDEEYSVREHQTRIVLRNKPVTTLSSFQWRAGTVDNPNWDDFIASNYVLEENGRTGVIQFFGKLPHGTNMVRASYTAGYKIDFDNPTDSSKHELPQEVSLACEMLVVNWYTRRRSTTFQDESIGNMSATFADQSLPPMTRDVINRYRHNLMPYGYDTN